MSNLRFKALEILQSRIIPMSGINGVKASEYFASNVFTREAMRTYLPEEVFKSLLQAIETGSTVNRTVANEVAQGMKTWAMSKGVTHYTHWFQPLTGSTAEKHDAFFELNEGIAFERFSGGSLAQQEPDASSFPSGGIRNTFEARGYTAWDPSSPAFIIEMSGARTLCIPTIFVSYTGESLDYKAPLLKALHLVDKAATEVCQFFDKNVTKVIPTLGVEQEYFLVDKALFEARPDLILTGRTLFGAEPAKGQQLEDHYFGSIPERVYAVMVDFEVEALKLGIPLKTRHNEVAPGQFECAPIFEEVNIAVDHNALLMDVMDRIAKKHNFRVLFHEKPFSKVNGSGKHNNWSLSTNTGKNLLSPGKAPKDNLQFLTFFVNVIKAVHDHADLLRATIATAGNDHRLGANEAPPAIMSIFIGEQLTHVLEEIEKPSSGKKEKETGGNAFMKLGINKIPEILLDNTDRNRTSPFAFTGNKFEFRAVGSSANSSAPMIALNTIVANQLMEFKKEVETRIESGEKKDLVILDILKGYIKKSKKILFEGNGYGDAWVKEAEKRGLSNVKTTPHALGAYISKPSIKVFEENGIFTERELEARYEIKLETYIKKVQIESRVLGDLALNHIIPTAITYQNELIENVKGLKELDLDKAYYEVQIDNIRKISDYLVSIRRNVYEMIEERKKANVIEEGKEKAIAYCEKVFPYFDKIRYASDKLEAIVDDQRWPLPKYRELLFLR